MDTQSIKNNIPADYLIQTKTEQVKKAQNEMGKDQFLQLLVKQLQNQDPMSPQENTEFIAQMAQFSALEAMNNMAAAFTQNQTFAMVGKGVVGMVYDLNGVGSQVIGVVDSAGVENNKPYIMVGDKKVMSENIVQVFDASIVQGNTQSLIASANLVGKFVSAEIAVDGQNVSINGRVDGMTVEEDKFFLFVDGHRVLLNSVTAVADSQEDLAAAVNAAEEAKAAEQAAKEAAKAAADSDSKTSTTTAQ